MSNVILNNFIFRVTTRALRGQKSGGSATLGCQTYLGRCAAWKIPAGQAGLTSWGLLMTYIVVGIETKGSTNGKNNKNIHFDGVYGILCRGAWHHPPLGGSRPAEGSGTNIRLNWGEYKHIGGRPWMLLKPRTMSTSCFDKREVLYAISSMLAPLNLCVIVYELTGAHKSQKKEKRSRNQKTQIRCQFSSKFANPH